MGPEKRRGRASFRPEIQGLRAVAVGLVVFYHLWPLRFSGGFVGVDVFFVISGYLITSHIYREVERTGTISLLSFWARRIRRLLPASLLVLATSTLAVLAWVPLTQWASTARQVGASALYVQNWALASESVDYMAQGSRPTVAQHFWSLSLEEQFYVLWPLLVLGTVVLLRRRPHTFGGNRRHALIAVLGAVGLVSLVWSVWATSRDQATAYFITPTRVWEFVIGALLALVPLSLSRHWAPVVGLVGVAAIVFSGFAFDGATLFPGWIAAIPTVGAAAVMLAGPTSQWWSPGRWLSLRPATFVGDISYSVYLWHWPLIVVVPFVTGNTLVAWEKVLIVAVTVLLSWGTKVWVEDRFRTSGWIATSRSHAYRFALVGMAVVVAMGLGIQGGLADRQAAAQARLTQMEASDCFGPEALDPSNGCESVTGSGPMIPALEVVTAQNTEPGYPDCQQGLGSPEVESCVIGSADPDPERTVAIIGDSHATQWFPALDALGQERNWRVETFTKTACPATHALRVLPSEQTDDAQSTCLAWVDNVTAELAARPDISYVFTTAYSSAYSFEAPEESPFTDPAIEGFAVAWSQWRDQGHEVFVIAAIPRTQGDNVPDCLALAIDEPMRCATERSESLPHDPLVTAAMTIPGDVRLIDVTDQLCDVTICYPVVGDLVVYRDYSHLSAEYSTALAPYIGAQIDAS